MVKQNDFMLYAQKLLSQKVAKFDKFLSLTACLNIEERELIGYCRAFTKLFPANKEFNEFLEKKIIPAFVVIGQSKWFRSELTDLGFKLSDKNTKSERIIEESINNDEFTKFKDEEFEQ